MRITYQAHPSRRLSPGKRLLALAALLTTLGAGAVFGAVAASSTPMSGGPWVTQTQATQIASGGPWVS
ncbi:MAG TPA: hypothetical protein VGP82_01930 [Ktedonobacterales bacterium]|jgi:hypothetical protein|nr:hypothetical protein [Ktedonobacterales bacterium]